MTEIPFCKIHKVAHPIVEKPCETWAKTIADVRNEADPYDTGTWLRVIGSEEAFGSPMTFCVPFVGMGPKGYTMDLHFSCDGIVNTLRKNVEVAQHFAFAIPRTEIATFFAALEAGHSQQACTEIPHYHETLQRIRGRLMHQLNNPPT